MPAERTQAGNSTPLGLPEPLETCAALLALQNRQEAAYQALLDCHVKTQRALRLLQFREARQLQAFQKAMQATQALRDGERSEELGRLLDEAQATNGEYPR